MQYKICGIFWRKYSTCIILSLTIALIVYLLIYIQYQIGGQVTIIQISNQTGTTVKLSKNTLDNVFSVIYVLIGGLFTFLINEYRSVKSEERIFSVLKTDIKTNLDILLFNKSKIELENRSKGISYIPLKLFKTDFWNLINYIPPRKIINEELYSKIGKAALIMNSFNEINQTKEFHKILKDERVPKVRMFNIKLSGELDTLSKLLNEINNSLDSLS